MCSIRIDLIGSREESQGNDYNQLVSRLCDYYREGDYKPKAYDLRVLADKKQPIRTFMIKYEQLSARVTKEDITDEDRLMCFMRDLDLTSRNYLLDEMDKVERKTYPEARRIAGKLLERQSLNEKIDAYVTEPPRLSNTADEVSSLNELSQMMKEMKLNMMQLSRRRLGPQPPATYLGNQRQVPENRQTQRPAVTGANAAPIGPGRGYQQPDIITEPRDYRNDPCMFCDVMGHGKGRCHDLQRLVAEGRCSLDDRNRVIDAFGVLVPFNKGNDGMKHLIEKGEAQRTDTAILRENARHANGRVEKIPARVNMLTVSDTRCPELGARSYTMALGADVDDEELQIARSYYASLEEEDKNELQNKIKLEAGLVDSQVIDIPIDTIHRWVMVKRRLNELDAYDSDDSDITVVPKKKVNTNPFVGPTATRRGPDIAQKSSLLFKPKSILKKGDQLMNFDKKNPLKKLPKN
jgi:hypothetical protein